MKLWILDDEGDPQPVSGPDAVLTWGRWFEHFPNRQVLLTKVSPTVRVSTVFLGLDHQFGDGPPLLFETMVFGSLFNEWQWRSSTRLNALLQHQFGVDLVTSWRAAPRRTRLALAKHVAYPPRRVTPREGRRVNRVYRRIQVGPEAMV